MHHAALPLLAAILALPSTAVANDWPMWRYDAYRSAASPHAIPADLRPLWTRHFTPRKQVWDDPLNLDLMTYDRLFEPIVVGGRLIVGFNDQDKVIALDTKTGETQWTFFAEGPVRFPPVGHAGKVYFVSDDGHLYCVDAASGAEVWKFRGGPSPRKALGNQRLTSAWPARGGPVVRDDRVYFAASIWPFMGVFIYALDAQSGDVEWVNDSLGAQYIRQPHSAPSFAGVAPQGTLVATEDSLIVPGGRSVPAVLDRHTGKLRYFEINAGGKGNGGSFVVANDRHYFVHTRLRGTRAFELATGTKTAFQIGEPVLSGDLLYTTAEVKGKPFIRAYRSAAPAKPSKAAEEQKRLVWEIPVDASNDLIQAGNLLVAAGSKKISVVQLPSAPESAEVVKSIPVDFEPARVLAADGKLFAVSPEGSITAFGSGEPAVQKDNSAVTAEVVETDVSDLVNAGDAEGFALWFGIADDEKELLDGLHRPFVQVAVVDENSDRIRRVRERFDAFGLHGRVTGHVSDPVDFMAPPYVANMVFVGKEYSASLAANADRLRAVYESVRPYGGVLQLLCPEAERKAVASAVRKTSLPEAEVQLARRGVVVKRVGRLPGAADWTHQYGDIGNTVKSDDKRVRLPLGILWFGGPSNTDVLPRHGHGPPEQVIGGRLFIEGHNSLSARDVYTGRVLWKREFDDLGTYDVYYDETYKDTPLNPAYNQVHIPGANARGTNFVATDDAVYIVEKATCHVLDPASGKTKFDIELPQADPENPKEWGFIGVYEDVLIGGVGFANYRKKHELTFLTDLALTGNAKGFGSKSYDRAASLALVGFDRNSGEQLWQVNANHSFWHNGIVAGNGKIFCLDKNPHAIEEALKRRGKSAPKTYRILAIDAATGERRWEYSDWIFGTWLGYDAEKDLLLHAGARASDRLTVEIGKGMAVYRGTDGSVVWQKPDLSYSGPCILHNEYIITNTNSYAESAGAFRLTDGRQRMVENPLTGELQPWKITRAYGCNSVIACENFLTFRSGAAGFYDLETDSGTGNLGGFKSGCTSNLVVANGVLNAPDYTRTCSCAYQNQTSLALVHMPEIDMWTVNHDANSELAIGSVIEQLGINFGAPGDRRAEDGTLWLEYPVVAGASPPIRIQTEGDVTWFQQHTASVSEATLPWVQSSGLRGATRVRIAMRLEDPVDLDGRGLPIASDSDDAEESANGGVSLSSSDLELTEDSTKQLVGLRFTRVPLARGTQIQGAWIQFTADEVSDQTTELTIHAEDTGDSPPLTDTQNDLSNRSRTQASVGWAPPKWAKAGVAADAQKTTDVSALVQAVVSREDWEPGNALTFLISGSGKRVARSAQGRNSGAARLIVKARQVELRDEIPPRDYQVRLYFGMPRGAERTVFDVYLQGQLVGRNVQLTADTPSAVRPVARLPAFTAQVGEVLDIELRPSVGQPVLSGIQLNR